MCSVQRDCPGSGSFTRIARSGLSKFDCTFILNLDFCACPEWNENAAQAAAWVVVQGQPLTLTLQIMRMRTQQFRGVERGRFLLMDVSISNPPRTQKSVMDSVSESGILLQMKGCRVCKDRMDVCRMICIGTSCMPLATHK
jgi:hypothetical protein